MDINKIVQLRLFKEDLKIGNIDTDYWFNQISINHIDTHIPKLNKVIQYHHEDIGDWDGIPTLDIIRERLEFGSHCNLHMYRDTILGWHWTHNQYVTEDWRTPYQKLKHNEIYIGGAFISRKHKPSPISSYKFYAQGFKFSLEVEGKDTMYLYSDDWNRASAQLCYKCGFTKYNFLDENK